MVVRDTPGLLIPFALPLLILVMNALGSAKQVVPGTGGRTTVDLYVVPLALAIGTATIAVVNLPSFLAYYRTAGVLRQLAVTPARPIMVLVAQLVVSAAQTAAGIALALGIATVAFDVHLPAAPAGALGVLCLAALAMYAVGLLVAAVAPTGNAAVAIGMTLFFAMGAVGGMFGGTGNLPGALAGIGEALPFGAAVKALGAAWAGATPQPAQLVSLAVTVVVCGLLAARLFRWR
ncbi:ABC transporter permease [Amycolatopsis suaedae]|uniref:ABC transporter permease n=2 Tax=Amycolatopsis suaedae TaxID=2510978 RepID=A0A4Q7J4G8_9PSEU|nr:ABC transporter permease [Amycolatopsis suaedae]